MDVSGGGVLVAVAAALWVAYLLPSWFRRRQYLATERNAVRLQQTLRILAETAETPEEVHVDATAREVAAQRRRLRKRQHELDRAAARRIDALIDGAVVDYDTEDDTEAEPTAPSPEVDAAVAEVDAGTLADLDDEAGPAVAVVPEDPVVRAQRARAALRRGRLACTLSLLFALVATAVGGGILSGGGMLPGALVLGGGLLVAALAGSGLVRLAHRRIAVVPVAVSADDAAPAAESRETSHPIAASGSEHAWTPQPLPRPLTLARGTIAAMAMASIEEAGRLADAARAADFERRAAELDAADVPSLPVREEPAAAPAEPVEASPYARMGYLDEEATRFDGLDAALARRRAVG